MKRGFSKFWEPPTITCPGVRVCNMFTLAHVSKTLPPLGRSSAIPGGQSEEGRRRRVGLGQGEGLCDGVWARGDWASRLAMVAMSWGGEA